jgi:hypothetical protein
MQDGHPNPLDGLAGLDLTNLNPIDRVRVIPMRTAEALTSLSPESLRRGYREFVLRLSARRDGMRLGVVADIVNGKLQPRIVRKRKSA